MGAAIDTTDSGAITGSGAGGDAGGVCAKDGDERLAPAVLKVLALMLLEVLVMAQYCSTAVFMKELAPINNGGDFGGTSGADGGTSTSWR